MLNLDLKLVLVGLSVLVSLIISLIVLRNNKKSISNINFFFFTIFTIGWGIVNYLNYQINFSNGSIILLFLRLNLLLGLWQSFFLFNFFLIFPKQKYSHKNKLINLVALPLVIFTSILIFTKYVFSSLIISSADGGIEKVDTGFGIILFGLLATSLVITGLFLIYKKYLKYKGLEKTQVKFILIGSLLMFSSIILFNLILPNFFNNYNYVSISAIYVIPFLILTSYSVVKYHLFNIKVITTELTVFTLWIFLFARTLITNISQERVINGILFIIVVIVGNSLIKSVKNEVRQREKLEELKIELEKANKRLKELDQLKTEFLSLASHQIRGPLTVIRGYTSMILEGDYGKISKTTKEIIERVLLSSLNLIKIVEDLLNVSKIEQGGMKYELEPFDLNSLISETVKNFSINAESKGLKINFNPKEKICIINGDKDKLRQVILNLIDNSIKYTKEGEIYISNEKKEGKVVISIKDNGMGMTEEVKKLLFKKFSRGEGNKMNTSGTGLGLYLAKEIIEAHRGKIWVESPGPNKGSTFFIELKAE